jgi:hypothetical protein
MPGEMRRMLVMGMETDAELCRAAMVVSPTEEKAMG